MIKLFIKGLIVMLSLTVMSAYAFSVCQTWNVKINNGGETATWKFNYGTPLDLFGSGVSHLSQGLVSYQLEARIAILAHSLYVNRTQSSDKNSCIYTGVKRNDFVHGTFICSTGTPTPIDWSAHISSC